jgi:hypothetical protein
VKHRLKEINKINSEKCEEILKTKLISTYILNIYRAAASPGVSKNERRFQ